MNDRGRSRRSRSGAVIDLRHAAAQYESRLEESRSEQVQAVLDGSGLSMVFQPIFELEARQPVGYEALARFAEGTGGPAHWFAEAAAMGLGVRLELSAARAACSEIDRLPPGTFLAINLSPDTACSLEFRAVLADVPHDLLVIEMTEHVPVSDYHRVDRAFRELRWQGVRMAIDDVGAGYASLRHILELAPDFIKLDMTLTRDIDTQRPRRRLAAALSSFARDMGAEIIAEGIETQQELETLQSLGIRLGQGFHLGVPGPLPTDGAA